VTPTEQIRKPRFVVALGVALLGAVVAGFVIALPVPRTLFGVLIVVLGMFVAGYAMLKLRPGTTGVLAAPVAVLITAGTVFVVLVLRRPKWQPGQQPSRRKTNLDRDFL
jgi:hypothetical protein